MYIRLLAPLAVAAALTAAPALATTIDVGGSFNTSGGPSFYVANFDFVLPADFTSASLHITNLQVDDRGVVELNGAEVDAAGIFGSAVNGAFDFNDGAGLQAHTFRDNGASDILVTSGFLAGANALRLFVNDTGNGIFGGLSGGGAAGPAGLTGYFFEGQVTYDEPSAPGVPEPAAWALMILGFGLAGAALRRTRGLSFA